MQIVGNSDSQNGHVPGLDRDRFLQLLLRDLHRAESPSRAETLRSVVGKLHPHSRPTVRRPDRGHALATRGAAAVADSMQRLSTTARHRLPQLMQIKDAVADEDRRNRLQALYAPRWWDLLWWKEPVSMACKRVTQPGRCSVTVCVGVVSSLADAFPEPAS